MAQQFKPGTDSAIVVTGFGQICLAPTVVNPAQGRLLPFLALDQAIDVKPWLKTPKTNKFMGKQDRLAVIAAGEAIRCAGIPESVRSARCGLYLSVGYIPFEQDDIQTLVQHSADNGKFSIQRFGAEAINQVNPLLTFRCLPNMPAFHISLNYALQGDYFVAYPDVGQWYVALEEAVNALDTGIVDYALVGAVADQQNFLVHSLARRLTGTPQGLFDTAGFICLETARHAAQRQANLYAGLVDYDIEYAATDLQQSGFTAADGYTFAGNMIEMTGGSGLGPAAAVLPLCSLLQQRSPADYRHQAETLNGCRLHSVWELPG